MAGARGRKLDLSGYLSGNAHVASILANTDESGGIGGILNGVASGVTRAGVNMREDKQRAAAKAERDADRARQKERDAFNDKLALSAEARAKSDQLMQEEDHKRKIAADAKVVEETASLLARAKASESTGMPMDPKVIEEIHKRSTAIHASGGPEAIMARAAAMEEPDVERLIAETSRLDTLTSLITAQMGREKDPTRHAALGDSLMELGALVDTNKYRLKLHDANTKRRTEEADKKRKFEEARATLEAEGAFGREESVGESGLPEVGTWGREPVNLTDAERMLSRGTKDEDSGRRVDAKTAAADAENVRLRATYKARTGRDAPEDVDIKALRTWEVQDERTRAVAEDRAAAAKVRERQVAETERHNRATEQLRALGNNPNKDRLKAFADSARMHLANAKAHGDPNNAAGSTDMADSEMVLAGKALDDFDKLMRESGGVGTAPEKPWANDPKYKALTPEKRAEFDAEAARDGK